MRRTNQYGQRIHWHAVVLVGVITSAGCALEEQEVTEEREVAEELLLPDDIGAPYQISGPPVAANPHDRYVLPFDKHLLVITDSGQVFAHEVLATVAPAYQLDGVVSIGPHDKWVVVVGHAIVVVSDDGSARTYPIDSVFDGWNSRPTSVQAAQPITSPTPIAANSVDRFVLGGGNRLLVITSAGGVWSHPLESPTQFGAPFQIDVQVPVATNSVDKWLMFLAPSSDLVVITSVGEVWAHPLVSGPDGVPYKLSGPRVASLGPDRWALPQGSRVLVITDDGRVFAHQLFPNVPG